MVLIMLIERFNENTKELECLDSDLDFIAFTGYGKTREIARYAYFSKSIIKDPAGIVNLKVMS